MLFLDEPTTGLDAVHANEVMATVKALTVGGGGGGEGGEGGDESGSSDEEDDYGSGTGENSNKNKRSRRRQQQAPITVCATIHSPTPFAYSLFDSLVLLIGERDGDENKVERERKPNDDEEKTHSFSSSS